MPRKVSFTISQRDERLVAAIVDRFAEIGRAHGNSIDRLSLRMDLVACHANGCPMDFARLADADDFNLIHDVGGIRNKIDRTTGTLTDFRPRFAAKPKRRAA